MSDPGKHWRIREDKLGWWYVGYFFSHSSGHFHVGARAFGERLAQEIADDQNARETDRITRESFVDAARSLAGKPALSRCE